MDAKGLAVYVNALQWRLHERLGAEVSYDDARTLRKAAQALRSWYKAEHGYSRELLVRDEQGWARAYRLHGGRYDVEHSRTVPDREVVALREVAQVCARCGLGYRTTRDFRGPALFVFSLSDRTAYPQAVACE